VAMWEGACDKVVLKRELTEGYATLPDEVPEQAQAA